MKHTVADITRRTFIKGVCSLGLAMTLSPSVLTAKTLPAIRKAIPGTNELLPVIGMGTFGTFDAGDDEQARDRLQEVLQAFFDHGGAVIDSSPMYGSAEQVTGDLLRRIHNKDALFAATKVWTWGRRNGIRQMQRSAQRMGVRQFDLMQIHNLRDWQVHLETLKTWKAKDKIRYIGVTTSHGRDHRELETLLKSEPFDFVQFSYNIRNRVAEQRLLPIAKERGIAVLINRPFQRGSLFRAVKGKPLPDWASEFDCASWAQFFLKFIVSHPAVTCVIPATSRVHHMIDNMGAGFGYLPDAALRGRMVKHLEQL
jgi:diketogulonate reductase-like aldo/keto reductase